MKKFISKFIKSFKESNRSLHFYGGIAVGLVLSILGVIGCAAGLEFKDKIYSNYWDWKDFGFTLLGGIIGQAL